MPLAPLKLRLPIWRAGRQRVRTPTVLQMEAVECGAASLAIVLGSFGRMVPLEELRLACGVTRDGSKASDLLRAARQYGLVAKGFRREPADLPGMPLPMVAYWNFNHFLVIEGFGRQGVYLNDPARGRYWVSDQEFSQSFTGLALTFAPGPDFKAGGERHDLLRSIARRFKGSQAGILYVMLASLGLIVPGLVIPGLMQIFVDSFLVQGRSEWLGVVFAGLALAAVLRGAFTWLQQSALLRIETRLALSNASQFFWRLLHLPMTFYFQRSAGEVGSRVAANDRVARLLSGELATAIFDLLTALFFAALMLHYNPLLAVTGIGISLINLGVLYGISRRRMDTSQQLMQERGKLFGVGMSGLLMIENLKASGTENDFFARWAGYQAKTLNAEQQLGLATQFLSAAPPFLAFISNGAILVLGSLQVMQGNLTLGGLVAFQSLLASFAWPVNRLVGLGGVFQETSGEIIVLEDVQRNPPDPLLGNASWSEVAEGASTLPRLSGRLEVRGLTFGYNRFEPPVIEDFDLSLKPGDRVALVGGSGSGKSTIARLIAGLYLPWRGEIRLDGVLRAELPRHWITNSVAMVDQDIRLFEGTVRENLALWDETTPTATLVQAARDACIHDDISARPKGYDGPVEEEGRNFSGGQRQRLEIARALACQPALLIMDEATSALDAVTEKQIDDNLRQRGCTCLIVAHRLSTIRDCDEIIVMENGHIVQRGTHEELQAQSGSAYAHLVQADVAAPRKSRLQSLLERLE